MFALLSPLLLLAIVAPRLDAYTFSEYLNTDNGYCEGDTYGPIPVGEEGFDDTRCERIECSQGLRHVAGCGKVLKPDNPHCRIVQGEGHYPNCCPDIKCHAKIV
ncbi:toxin-like protein 14 [Argiope bruennichi]|uniref:toxin-like protein 14 n=1 Tax=Argiope bruennichi TaxID=94029 RepID=UPI0024940FE4|nr:toxin-like protein 14 [Argiope bruennichi]